MPAPRPSHIGICVSDIDAATRFYCDAFGFAVTSVAPGTDRFNRLLDLAEGTELKVSFIAKGDFIVELLSFKPAAAKGSKRAMDQAGFTHLAIAVEAVDPVAERVAAAGGTLHWQTRLKNEFGEFMFCTDPDGTRIELMCLAGE